MLTNPRFLTKILAIPIVLHHRIALGGGLTIQAREDGEPYSLHFLCFRCALMWVPTDRPS